MNNLDIIDGIRIENLIYEVRGKQVMLDSDLAKIYKCKNGTKSINLAVKRHIDRFPERFMFKLTEEEYNNLKFQSETSSYNSHGGVYLRRLYLRTPYRSLQEEREDGTSQAVCYPFGGYRPWNTDIFQIQQLLYIKLQQADRNYGKAS